MVASRLGSSEGVTRFEQGIWMKTLTPPTCELSMQEVFSKEGIEPLDSAEADGSMQVGRVYRVGSNGGRGSGGTGGGPGMDG